MRPHEEFLEDDWTPEERERLASLPAERIPPSELKTRTVAALRRGGLVDGSASGMLEMTDRATRRSRATLAMAAALVAAASLIFIAGALVGYVAARRAARTTDESRTASREAVANAREAGSTLQPRSHVVWY